jgi:hypothetical protein
MNRVQASLAGAALGFLFMAAAIGFIIQAPRLMILRLHHASTTGRVVRVIPNSHGLTEIAYSVHGTQYTREVPGYWVSPQKPGEPLWIYYDPIDPRVAAAAPADQILIGQFPAWIAVSLLGAVAGRAIVLGLASRNRSFPRRDNTAG